MQEPETVVVHKMALFVLAENAKLFLKETQKRRERGEVRGNPETEAWLQSAVDKAQEALTAPQQITAPDRLPHSRCGKQNESAAGGG